MGKSQLRQTQANKMRQHLLADFLPTARKECDLRGWNQLGVTLFSGEAHASRHIFGAAVTGRAIEGEGDKAPIAPQPNRHGDHRDFKKPGRPRPSFGVCPGATNSMANHHAANRRLRRDDAYSLGARHDTCPNYPSVVYTQLRSVYPQACFSRPNTSRETRPGGDISSGANLKNHVNSIGRAPQKKVDKTTTT